MRRSVLKTAAIMLLILAGSLVSCGKKEESKLLKLGMYVETYPLEERVRINLISREKLVIITDGEGNISEFYYIINYEEEIIDLTLIPSSGEEIIEHKFYFKIISDTKFEISNLYPGTAVEKRSPIMTFEKENK